MSLRIANRVNQQYLRREGDYVYNDAVDSRKQGHILTFTSFIVPSIPLEQNSITFRVGPQPDGKFISRAATSWGRIDIYSGDSKGHFSLRRRDDGYYNILNVDDNLYMYMYSDEKSYINSDGKPENANAQWRVEGLPEPYLTTGDYAFSFPGKNTRIERNANGQLAVASYGGFGANRVLLLRQDDGSYLMKFGGFVRESADSASFGSDATQGTKFYVAQTQNRDAFTIRDGNGRYWWADPAKPGTLITTVGEPGSECDWDPCDGPPITSGRRVIPPECQNRPPQVCRPPLAFSLVRDWTTGR